MRRKRVIYLIGLPGVGKTTIGLAISKLTGYALLDNHLTYREICHFIPQGTPNAHLLNGKMHLAILKMLLKSGVGGIICTLSIRLHPTTQIAKKSVQLAKKMNAEIFFFRIECDWQEHKNRILMPSRKEKTKTNTIKKFKEKLKAKIFQGLKSYPPIIINNTHLSPQKCALKIINFLGAK
ncbi:MAG TPA: hypothetical protein VJC12_02935 [Candidatus Paceibacterota bacterium]